MKVFISWSGVRSQAVAQTLYTWLKDVIQAIDPWLSTEEIRKGKQWSAELTLQLESTHIGVICLTPENLTAPWLLFEAGALSKLQREKDAHVCTYLIEMPYAAVTGPLESFQHTLATKADTFRMLQSINAAIDDGPGRLTDAELSRAFQRCWPELEQCLKTLPDPQAPVPPPRTTEDMLQEILESVRGLVKPPLPLTTPDETVRRVMQAENSVLTWLQKSGYKLRPAGRPFGHEFRAIGPEGAFGLDVLYYRRGSDPAGHLKHWLRRPEASELPVTIVVVADTLAVLEQVERAWASLDPPDQLCTGLLTPDGQFHPVRPL